MRHIWARTTGACLRPRCTALRRRQTSRSRYEYAAFHGAGWHHARPAACKGREDDAKPKRRKPTGDVRRAFVLLNRKLRGMRFGEPLTDHARAQNLGVERCIAEVTARINNLDRAATRGTTPAARKK